jgi:hypothetical protein
MPGRLRWTLGLLAAASIMGTACGSSGGETANTTDATAAPRTSTTVPEAVRPIVDIDGSQLPPLPETQSYVLWFESGRFSTSMGELAAGEVTTFDALDMPEIGTMFVTIETEAPTIDSTPSTAVVMAGELVDQQARLTSANERALGTDFSDASGGYILATPTSASEDDERSGIWWTDIPRAQSLFLPEPPAGWVYEGWVVIDGTPLSTGTFSDPFASDAAAPFSGPEEAPPLVGEDFIVNPPDGLTFPVDLRGSEAFITLEPATVIYP